MSFPDFAQVENGPNFEEGGFNDFQVDNQNDPSMNQGDMNAWNNLGGRNEGNIEMVNEEEEQRIAKRKEEENQRRKVIEERMQLELKEKEAKRESAMDFMNEFERKRANDISLRKQNNLQLEKDNLDDRQMMKEGKKNPWEKVIENITIKESEYKGTKNVARMRSCILSRKGDFTNNK